MALIKLSAIGITALSGKAGGSVFSRNRGGSYAKNFVMPSNTFSEARQAVKAAFGALSSLYRTLTPAQLASWSDLAPEYPVINRVGDTKVLSPNALFVRLNKNIQSVGGATLLTCQTPQGTNGAYARDSTPIFDNNGSGSWSLDYLLEEDNTTPGNEYILEATPPLPASIKNVSNRFRVLATTNDTNGTVPTSQLLDETAFATDAAGLFAAYVAKFGAAADGSVISFRIKAVNTNTGEVSAYYSDQVTVITAT